MKRIVLLTLMPILLIGCSQFRFQNFSKQKFTRLKAEKHQSDSEQVVEESISTSVEQIDQEPDLRSELFETHLETEMNSNVNSVEEEKNIPEEKVKTTRTVLTTQINKRILNRVVKKSVLKEVSEGKSVRRQFDTLFGVSMITLLLAMGALIGAFSIFGFAGIVAFFILSFISWYLSLLAFLKIKHIPKEEKKGAFALEEILVTVNAFAGALLPLIGLALVITLLIGF